jgi:predicted DNA binding CopG/RHH family protein
MDTNGIMSKQNYDKQIGVRLAEPVFMELKRRAESEDLKVADLIRRAIRELISATCAPTDTN